MYGMYVCLLYLCLALLNETPWGITSFCVFHLRVEEENDFFVGGAPVLGGERPVFIGAGGR